MHTLFISDLHLTPERPAMIEAFRAFLLNRARQADALYILGDLFEYWIGDDGAEALGHRPAVDALRGLSDSGTALYVMHGNRDFLLGEEFAAAVGATLLPDPTRIRLADRDILLMHGDSLCTDDHEHQAFRGMVAEPQWRRDFLARPLEERQRTAVDARRRSRAAKATKAMEIMDVNDEAVVRTMARHGVRILIHGHTHRPAIHETRVDGETALRIVLGDWYEHTSALSIDGEGFHLTPGDLRAVLSPAPGGNLATGTR